MNLQAITMVRNEADLWIDFVTYNCRLFDKLIVVDHQSTDGTLEMTEDLIKQGFPIELLRYRYKGYYQAHLSNALARYCFDAEADWVFFIDADEFIDVPSRSALVDLLSKDDLGVVKFNWVNLVPTKFGSFEEFDFSQPFLSDGRVSRYGKVALHAAWAARRPRFDVQMGNHEVHSAPGVALANCRSIGGLFHLPIRSTARLRSKLVAGMDAYKARGASNSLNGFHWFEIHKSLEDSNFNVDQFRMIILNYGEPLGSFGGASPLTEVRLPKTTNGAESIRSMALTPKEVEARELALPWRHVEHPSGGDIAAVVVNGEIQLRPLAKRGDEVLSRSNFPSLPPMGGAAPTFPRDTLTSSLMGALAGALEPALVPVPSAWSGHVPFLFALVPLLYPRRYVELGSHFGMSFFAACQAAQKLSLATECIAVDLWRGDAHAGYYEESVFDQFRFLLKKHYPYIGHYIRSSFRSALRCFEEGSIDLLHIDGLHTYEAVLDDFRSWLPKMSDRGVILFHDTAVHENGFGVWRLWGELQERYPSFTFLHSHGLGVLYVGMEPSPTADLLRRLEADEALTVLVRTVFSGLGDKVCREAELNARIHEASGEPYNVTL